MKKNSFITFFIAANVILIFLQVHKHTLFIKANYDQQHYEKKIALLQDKKQTLTRELHALKDRENIKKFATEKLNMRPYMLSQVKRLYTS